jgi:uncharacterized protein (UPF0276 family)
MRKLTGAGLGFRRELIPALIAAKTIPVDFFEIAPENWMSIGGRFERDLRHFTERFPFTCHGLSLSLGGTEPLDTDLLKAIKAFIRTHHIAFYTEHLSWCTDDGHLYDLLPIPCTEEAVRWVARRIRQAQDILGMPIGVENASYYIAPPGAEMKEEEFISAIIKESGCFLHLDVNNIYVNSQNFGFDPIAYLDALPLDRVGYLHVAGHYVESDGLIIDTHGAEVIDPVWQLLEEAYARCPSANLPTCLERDFNFPKLNALFDEIGTLRRIQSAHMATCKWGNDPDRVKLYD